MVREDEPAADKPEHSRAAPARSRIIAVVVGALVLGLLVLAYVAFSTYEVVAEGRLLDYTPGTVVKIDVLGMTLYVEEGRAKPSLDLLNSWVLTAISSMALLVAVFYRFSQSSRSRVQWCFLALFVGAGYLAADELLAVHESLGHNLRFLRDLPGVTRPDDVIIALYVVPAAIFLIVFRDILLASRTARILFGVAFGLFVLTAAADLFSIPKEDLLEPIASLVLFAGFIALAVNALQRAAHEFAARDREVPA